MATPTLMNALVGLVISVGALWGVEARGQENAQGQAKQATTDQDSASNSNRELRIANYLTGARFVGSYTVDGRDQKELKEEVYEISKCEKLPENDMYRLTARIKYGNTDGEFPMDLKIIFSGNTPVITLDQVWIPGLGTFSARVLIHQGRYAGTWDHDKVGGHMLGRIEKAEVAAESK